MASNTVQWSVYAQTYDMLMAHNPFYQQLHAEILGEISHWKINENGKILDLGAGTGNYSTALAAHFPESEIFHIDNDEGMNEVASMKKEQNYLYNLSIFTANTEGLNLEPSSIDACICIHALYTFKDPQVIINKIYDWLVSGGEAILVDPGRKVNVLNWQLAIGWRMMRQFGVKKTLQIMKEGKEVSRQNRMISKMQANGRYWLHSHQEFCAAISSAGFEIINSKTCFRGISDMVIARKPE